MEISSPYSLSRRVPSATRPPLREPGPARVPTASVKAAAAAADCHERTAPFRERGSDPVPLPSPRQLGIRHRQPRARRARARASPSQPGEDALATRSPARRARLLRLPAAALRLAARPGRPARGRRRRRRDPDRPARRASARRPRSWRPAPDTCGCARARPRARRLLPGAAPAPAALLVRMPATDAGGAARVLAVAGPEERRLRPRDARARRSRFARGRDGRVRPPGDRRSSTATRPTRTPRSPAPPRR